MKISNVKVETHSLDYDYALSWETKDGRYHVWISHDGRYTMRPELFKNPLVQWENRVTTEKPAGFFKTRHLNRGIAKNKTMIQDALAEAVAGHLFEKCDQRLREAEAKRQADNRAAFLVRCAQEAGPEMLKVLLAIREFYADNNHHPLDPGALILDGDETIADAVNRVVNLAETGGRVEL